MKPPKPKPSACEERQAEEMLRSIDQHAALGIVLRWIKGVPMKPLPPSLLAKPDPHLIRHHGPVPPNVDRGT